MLRRNYQIVEAKVVEWRMKERVCVFTEKSGKRCSLNHNNALRVGFHQMRTVSVALIACLNIGVDPPDVVKPQPCARLECWEG